MKSFKINLDEFEITYILNCISLTRNLIYKGNIIQTYDYFRREDFTENNWNLWQLQMRLIIEGNKALYNSSRFDMSWAQKFYFDENKNLECFSKNIFKHKKEIFEFERNQRKIDNINILNINNSYQKFLSIIKKFA